MDADVKAMLYKQTKSQDTQVTGFAEQLISEARVDV